MKEEVSKKVGFRNNIIKDDKATKRIQNVDTDFDENFNWNNRENQF